MDRPPAGGPLVTSDPGLVRGEVELLLAKLRDALAGRPPESLEPGPLDRLALLRMLRTEVVRACSEDEGDLLDLLRAFEATQEALLEWRRDATVSEALTPFSRRLLREVAHLLRSPLGSIVMLADNLREERNGPLNEAQLRQIEIIHRAALNLAATAGDILTLVREEERVERMEPFHVGDALETVADIVRPVTEARGRALIVRAEVDGERRGPAAALREVLLDLALRATLLAREGEVELGAIADDGEVVLFRVASRSEPPPGGAGPDRVDLLEVFRVDVDTGSFTLSPQGLGMAAAHEVLRTLGSVLDVEDGPAQEHRMTFRLVLPQE